jgi:hypothetical protein
MIMLVFRFYLSMLLLIFLAMSFIYPHSHQQSKYDIYSFPYMHQLREQFQYNFEARCSRYPFVQHHNSLLQQAQPQRFLVFVFQQAKLRNGGLGDRLAGLVTAISLALRFNRTLLIQSEGHLDALFRPYSPSSSPVYSYKKTNKVLKSLPVYRLKDCINAPGRRNGECSLEAGDVAQYPVIVMALNRAFLCRELFHTSLPAHQSLLQLLGLAPGSVRGERYSNASALQRDVDLFEAAGCLLRLALWPTDRLWQEVDRAYDRMAQRSELGKGGEPMVQIGMHFRCGDRSYSSEGNDGYSSPSLCLYDAALQGLSKEQLVQRGVFNVYKLGGDPRQVGRCAGQVAASYRGKGAVLLFAASDHAGAALQMSAFARNASSSFGSSFSSGLTAGALVSPPGCHVDLQSSAACTLTTTVYWLILALSDVIVAQAETSSDAVTSAFSRFALIYGLKRDAYRDARTCHAPAIWEMAQRQAGNWFCYLHDRPKSSGSKNKKKNRHVPSASWFTLL